MTVYVHGKRTGRYRAHAIWQPPPGVVEVDAPYGGIADGIPPLTVGMFVDVEITGRSVKDVRVLPRAALRSGDCIWIIDGDSLLRVLELVPRHGALIFCKPDRVNFVDYEVGGVYEIPVLLRVAEVAWALGYAPRLLRRARRRRRAARPRVRPPFIVNDHYY